MKEVLQRVIRAELQASEPRMENKFDEKFIQVQASMNIQTSRIREEIGEE